MRCAEALDKHAAAVSRAARPDGGSPCASISSSTTSPAFSITRKRRNSFASETQVRRGDRVVRGDVELTEKLGRNDLCPCGSGRRFQTLLHGIRTLRRRQPRLLFSGSDEASALAQAANRFDSADTNHKSVAERNEPAGALCACRFFHVRAYTGWLASVTRLQSS